MGVLNINLLDDTNGVNLYEDIMAESVLICQNHTVPIRNDSSALIDNIYFIQIKFIDPVVKKSWIVMAPLTTA